MRDSSSSDDDHKRAFLKTFRRWEILFKRKDSNVESDKWLIAEYYKSLRHLSEAGLETLTDILKETCVFFPTIKECLDCTRHGPFDFAHPFKRPGLLRSTAPARVRLAAPVEQIEYDASAR